MSGKKDIESRGTLDRKTQFKSLKDIAIWTLMEVRTQSLSQLILPSPALKAISYNVNVGGGKIVSITPATLKELINFKLNTQYPRVKQDIFYKPRLIGHFLFVYNPDRFSWRWIYIYNMSQGIQILNNNWADVKKSPSGSVMMHAGPRYPESRSAILKFLERVQKTSAAKQLYYGKSTISNDAINKHQSVNRQLNQWTNEFLYQGKSLEVAKKLVWKRSLNRFKAKLLELAAQSLQVSSPITPLAHTGRASIYAGRSPRILAKRLTLPKKTKVIKTTTRGSSRPRPSPRQGQGRPRNPAVDSLDMSLGEMVEKGLITRKEIADRLVRHLGGKRDQWISRLKFWDNQKELNKLYKKAGGTTTDVAGASAFYDPSSGLLHIGPQVKTIRGLFHEAIHAVSLGKNPKLEEQIGSFLFEGITERIARKFQYGSPTESWYQQGVLVAAILEKRIGAKYGAGYLHRAFLRGDFEAIRSAVKKIITGHNKRFNTWKFFKLSQKLTRDPNDLKKLKELLRFLGH